MKIYKLKLYKKIFLILLIFVINIMITSKSIAMDTNITTEQNAIKEVAMAYYNKGIFAQYCSYRKSFLYAPEEATSQHTIYSVCSDFTYSVYYQTFGIQIPDLTGKIIAYGEKYYDINNITTNDVIEYWKKNTDDEGNIFYTDNNGNSKDIDLSTVSGRKNYANTLLTEYNLQIGDVLCYHRGSSGHALLVYDILYDTEGNPVDALILESTSKYETNTTKITKGLSYAELPNENTNVTEGTFQARYLASTYTSSSSRKRNSFVYDLRNVSYCTILRPLLKDETGNYTGQYYDSDFTSNSNANTGYICTGRTLKNYETKEIALNRTQYSLINIEKTVDVFNNSVVNLEDTLEYAIKVTNNSEETYQSFDIIDNISEFVDIVDSAGGTIDDNTIKWTIPNLEAGDSIEIKYRVKVKKDMEFLGNEIISTGTVAGIPSSTIKNIISSNLDAQEKNTISAQAQSMINSGTYAGQEFISNLYRDSLGMDLSLENLDITDLVKARSATQYYPEGNINTPTIYLNQENAFSQYVLSNYYGALYTNSSTVYMKFWENTSSKISGRSERADTIYEDNLETGDILIYKNTQTANENVTYETEDGIYYLVYISEADKITVNENEFYGFIGIDEQGNIKKLQNDFTNLQTLLGKDYYVILRPSMAFAAERVGKQISKIEVTTMPTKTNYIQNYENLDLTGGIITVTYNDKSTDAISLTNENVKVTGFDNSTIGTNTLTVEYEGQTATFEVDIVSKEVGKIEVTTRPIKATYIQNYENLDLTGGVITVTYNDESTDTVSLTNENVKVTGFDNSTIGTNTLIIEYEGKTTTFEIDIVSKEISKIEITILPTKTNYIQNKENLDLTGGVITVTYNDESIDTISLTNEKIKVTGFDNRIIGTNTLTIEYEGETTTFDIEIIAQSDEGTQEKNENNGNNESNENKENNSIKTEKENEKLPTILPFTGIRSFIIIVLIGIFILSVVFYKKNKEFKDIK